MGQTIFSTTAHPEVLEDKIKKFEQQKEIVPDLWTDDLENELQEAKKQYEDLMSGESILSTKPTEGGITDIETEGGGWEWLKNLNPFKKTQARESFVGGTAGQNVKSIVFNLANTFGKHKAIQIATSQFGIPYQVAYLTLNPTIREGIKKKFKGMTGVDDTSLSSVIDQGIMAAGREDLRQKPKEIARQVAASQGQGDFAGYTPDPGNVQAAIITQQQMKTDAEETGGTVNPHEATQAAWTPPASKQPVYGPHGKAHGGMVGMNYLTRRL